MTGGTEFQEAVEAPQEKIGITEAREQLERATIEPKAAIEKGDHQPAELLQEAFVAVVEAAGDAASTVRRPETEGGEVGAAEAAADGGPRTEDGVEVAADNRVKIDTVPLPETPVAPTETGAREAIGTWPTPEVPAASVTEAQDLAGLKTEEQADQPEDQIMDPRWADSEVVSEEPSTADTVLKGRPEPAEITDSDVVPGPVDAADVSSSAVSEIINGVQDEANEFAATIVAQVESEGSSTPEASVADRSLESSSPRASTALKTAIRDEYMERGQDLQFFTQRIESINEMKEEVRTIPPDQPEGAAGSIAAVQNTIDFTGVAESRDIEESSTDSSRDKMTAAVDARAGERTEELTELSADQTEEQEQKKITSEEQQTLKDELADWPDGETREITVTTWEESGDGTSVKVEKTVTLTKEQAEDLLDQMEESPEEAEGRGVPYQLEEGSLLVGEADLAELAPDGSELVQELDILTAARVKEIDQQIEELSKLLSNYKETRSYCLAQASGLEDFHIQEAGYQKGTYYYPGLCFSYEPWTETDLGPDAYKLTMSFPVKQPDGTYKMIAQTKPVTATTYQAYIKTFNTYAGGMDLLIQDAEEKILVLQSEKSGNEDQNQDPTSAAEESSQSDTLLANLEKEDK